MDDESKTFIVLFLCLTVIITSLIWSVFAYNVITKTAYIKAGYKEVPHRLSEWVKDTGK